MEPIRPDSDEVAARKGGSREPERVAAERPRRGEGRQAPRGANAGSPARGSVFPLVLVALVAVAGSWMLFQQHQTIQQVQGNLGEAEDWINRSKLSMARFEGRLSEADRELLESGSQITEKLAFLDSEMRKLWGVANDRNRKSIEAHKKAIEFLENKADYLDKQRAEQRQLLTNQREQLEATDGKVVAIESRVAEAVQRQESLVQNLAANGEAVQALQQSHSELQGRLNTVSQRQILSLDELRARLDAVENKVAAAGDRSALNSLKSQLADLKDIVDSIDASRSQLTGRLLRLEERMQGASGG